MNDNKLIAEFMGMELGDDGTVYYDDAENIHPPTPADKLKFETSWDWLIPVIEKTLDLTFDENGEPSDFYDLRDCIPDIHHTYRAVVQFINQHNIRCTVKN